MQKCNYLLSFLRSELSLLGWTIIASTLQIWLLHFRCQCTPLFHDLLVPIGPVRIFHFKLGMILICIQDGRNCRLFSEFCWNGKKKKLEIRIDENQTQILNSLSSSAIRSAAFWLLLIFGVWLPAPADMSKSLSFGAFHCGCWLAKFAFAVNGGLKYGNFLD